MWLQPPPDTWKTPQVLYVDHNRRIFPLFKPSIVLFLLQPQLGPQFLCAAVPLFFFSDHRSFPLSPHCFSFSLGPALLLKPLSHCVISSLKHSTSSFLSSQPSLWFLLSPPPRSCLRPACLSFGVATPLIYLFFSHLLFLIFPRCQSVCSAATNIQLKCSEIYFL